jgi:hypothetical protein
MTHTVEFQEPILSSLLIEPWSVATTPNLNSVRTQFNIWKGTSESVVTLEIDPASSYDRKTIEASFVCQLDANGVPHC